MKLLVILGMLAAIGSAALAVMVRTSLKDLRLEKDDLNRSTLAAHKELTVQAESIRAVDATYSETQKSAKNEDISTKSLQSDIKGKEEELSATKKEIEELGGKKQAMQEEITRILGSTGTPEEILAKNEALKKDNDAKVQELEQIGKEAEVAKKAAAESETLISRLKQQQATRAKAIALVSRTGTISAVNPDFGFAVVNLGQNQGVSSESRLLVKRGNQLIGKLKIVQIYGSTTVADIDTKSITPGYDVQPGDGVIFENSPN